MRIFRSDFVHGGIKIKTEFKKINSDEPGWEKLVCISRVRSSRNCWTSGRVGLENDVHSN